MESQLYCNVIKANESTVTHYCILMISYIFYPILMTSHYFEVSNTSENLPSTPHSYFPHSEMQPFWSISWSVRYTQKCDNWICHYECYVLYFRQLRILGSWKIYTIFSRLITLGIIWNECEATIRMSIDIIPSTCNKKLLEIGFFFNFAGIIHVGEVIMKIW